MKQAVNLMINVVPEPIPSFNLIMIFSSTIILPMSSFHLVPPQLHHMTIEYSHIMVTADILAAFPSQMCSKHYQM